MTKQLTLRQRQSKFAFMFARLLLEIESRGYEVTFGDAFRDPRVHGKFGEKKAYGAANSFHKLRLAHDINLFKDGEFLEKTEDHQQFGEWWEAQGGSWGGRFKKPDGNHYSLGENR